MRSRAASHWTAIKPDRLRPKVSALWADRVLREMCSDGSVAIAGVSSPLASPSIASDPVDFAIARALFPLTFGSLPHRRRVLIASRMLEANVKPRQHSRSVDSRSPPLRKSRLVRDKNDTPFIWIVSSSDRGYIRCRVLQFHSMEVAEVVERAIARAILRGEPIDELTTRAGMLPSEFDEGTFDDAEVAAAYLASDKDPALRASARLLLAEIR
jgi:hypothetical protein